MHLPRFLLSLLSISRQSYKEGCLGLGGCVRCDAGTDKLGVAALIEATVGATVNAAEIGRAVPCTEDRKKIYKCSADNFPSI